MSTELITSLLVIAAALFAACGLLAAVAGIVAVLEARPLRFAFRMLAGALLLSLATLASTIAVGFQGYRMLTREVVAAHITVRPVAAQRFAATIRFTDGRARTFELAGDELYVDARILKWKPVAQLFGLHTAYELDRLAGRYHSVQQERSATRTIYPLGEEKPFDLFSLRRRYAFLSPLLDAEYGSATFVPVTKPTEMELRVSNTGLLLREATRP